MVLHGIFRRVSVLAGIVALTCAPAYAAPPEAPICGPNVARTVAFKALAERPEDYAGQCVRVRGLWAGRTLYSDLKGYYLSARQDYREDHPGERNPFTVGLYTTWELHKLGLKVKLVDAEVIGVAGVCWDLHRVLVFVYGYCHYYSGAYVKRADIRHRPTRTVRLTGERARQAYGNIVHAPRDWAHRPEVDAVAGRWLDAIRTGDIEGFSALGARRPQEEVIDRVFRTENSAFADFRGNGLRSDPAFFLRRTPQRQYGSNLFVDYHAVACFCRRDRCQSLWPISKADAANAPTRPFICVEIEQTDWDGRKSLEVTTRLDIRKLAEPAG